MENSILPKEPTRKELQDRIHELELEITSRKADQERLQRIVSALDVGLSLTHPDMTIAWVNDKILQMFPDTDPIGQTCHQFYESSPDPCEHCPVDRSFATGDANRLERYSPDSKRWFDIVSKPIRDTSGEITHVLCAIADITEKKRAEEALQESEKRYRFLTENLFDVVWIMGMDFRTTYVSPSVERVLGFTPEQRNRQTMEETVTPESLREIQKRIAEELQRDREPGVELNRSALIEVEYYRKDGSTVWMENRVQVVRDSEKNIVGMFGVSRDITERKRAEIALDRRSKERRLLLDTIPVQVWYLTDPDTYGALNRAHAEFLGYRPQDMAYRRLEEFRAPDVARVCKAGNIRVFESRKPVHTEEWVPNAAGEKRLISVAKTPRLDEKGEVEFVVCAGVDITDQRQTEMLLRKSEARFRHIFELSPVGTELYDRDGRLILANPACLEIFGVEDAQEVLSFRLFDDPNLDESLKQRLHRGEMVRYDVTFDLEKVRAAGLYRTRKEGILHLKVIITPMMQTGEEAPTGYLALVSDVTERITKEQRLRESERKYRLIAENMADTVWTMDMNMRFTYVSPSVTRMYGAGPEEVMDKTLEQILPPDSLQRVYTALAEGMSRDASGTAAPDRIRVMELEGRKNDGSTVWVESSMSFLRDENQKPIGIVGASRDVTDRRRAEEALRHEHMMLARTEGIAHVGSWEWDVATDTVSWSDELFRIFQRDPREGAPSFAEHSALYHPDDMGRMRQAVEACVAEGVPYELELRAIRKDGETRVCVGRGFAEMAPGGRAVRLFGLLQDITERKRADEERAAIEVQNRQLQKAESLGRMAGAIAHHFNNKLGAVMGNLEMAMGELPQASGPVESMREAMKAARGAADVSGQMLTYLGQKPGRRNTLDLCEVCRRTLPMLQAAMPGSVVMETDLPSSGSAIHANANQMEQVITNLVANAWEAIGDSGGAIHLAVETVSAPEIPSTHRFPVDWRPGGEAYASFEVRDTGPGIPEGDIEKLFDPFYSTKFTGRGLGLAVVLGIVRAHGGCIVVESGNRAGTILNGERGTRNAEPGGSVFRVFLPLSAEEVLKPTEKAAKALNLKRGGLSVPQGGTQAGTALVIEDEPQLRRLAERMMQLLGFAVLAAKDGVEGVEMFREHQGQIRLVLCDLSMPRMDGWGTLAALRKIRPSIPVILASGYDEASAMTGDHPEWPQSFLGKPYVIEDLREAIDKVMEPQIDTDRFNR
jgi:two-component system, cell cycle sensor histidine kinase and response regulator CckA